MEYTQSMRNRAFPSKGFPRGALYLFDELDNFLTKKMICTQKLDTTPN